MRKTIIAILLSINLVACGGGGSSSSNPPPPPSTQSVSGMWRGTATSSAFGTTTDLLGIVSESREAFFISSQGAQYHGSLSVSGAHVSGTVTSYAPVGFVFPDGSVVTTTSVSGTVTTKSSLSATYTGGGDSGSIALTYDPLYERDSSLSLIAGDWFDGAISISIDSLGRFSGFDTSGCTYSGQVSIINSSFDAYKVNVTASSCGGADGSYDGLAALSDNLGLNDTLTAGVSNGSFSLVTTFIGGGSSSISALVPNNATAGDPAFTLTVNGSGFTSSSIVYWNAATRPTTFAMANQLTAQISASDIATAGTVQVYVRTSGGIYGGGTNSNVVNFTVN